MIDIIVIAIIAFCAFRGTRRGFWLTLARLFGVFAATAAAWLLHPALKSWLKNEPALVTGLQKALIGPFMDSVSPTGAQEMLIKLADVLNRSELPTFIKKLLLTSGDPSLGALVTLNEATLSFISFIALLLGITLIIQGAALVLDRFFKLPGLSFLNRSAGALMGASEGVFLIWIALTVLTPVIAFRPNGFLAVAILGSQLTAWLYQHNYLLTLIDFTLK